MFTNIIIINIICIHINNKCCTCVVINFSELFSGIYPLPLTLWIAEILLQTFKRIYIWLIYSYSVDNIRKRTIMLFQKKYD